MECSATCGPGWRRRTLSCGTRYCEEKLKPKVYEQCNLRDCAVPSFRNTWKTSGWSRCTVTCGGGTQRRDVWCEDGRSKSRISDTECTKFGKPEPVRKCASISCTNGSALRYRWESGQWTSSVRSPTVERDQAHYHIKKRRRYRA
ncbi:unnamed protein product [Enterobius vermicularis]|uniref:ADAM_CR_2 domain-containing protein n=1 Tax=Enterobius vermicularis TaxID=51028 RepID=A0A0N4UTQ9_ENTVE|nr:unnamed protein product [Enterobius vermicularis]